MPKKMLVGAFGGLLVLASALAPAGAAHASVTSHSITARPHAAIMAATALPAAAPVTTSIGARPASVANAHTPLVTKRNIYVSQSGCEFAGWWGQLWGNWSWYTCLPRRFPQDPQLWWQLVTNP